MAETKITVWIVRHSAGSVQGGGLERLVVHFSEPTFYYKRKVVRTGDLPFSEPTEKCGIYEEAGWEEKGFNKKTWVQPLSVGNWLGYDNEVSHYIWTKLCEHFKNRPMADWEIMEKCKEVRREDFCLELELTIKI